MLILDHCNHPLKNWILSEAPSDGTKEPLQRTQNKEEQTKLKTQTYWYDVSYVLRIIQGLKSNSNHFVILKGRATTVPAIYCCINLLNALTTTVSKYTCNSVKLPHSSLLQ